MIDLSKISTSDWIGFYGAALSTAIAVMAGTKYFLQKLKNRRERSKFQTDLYFLRKIDRNTKQVRPIVVVLLANLGSTCISLKSLEYQGIAEGGSETETTGGMGWYEQPEELYGIRNRLLPIILKSGQTADLPMVEIGILTRIKNLKIWLTDFDDRRYYIAENDIDKVRRDIEKFLQEKASVGRNN